MTHNISQHRKASLRGTNDVYWDFLYVFVCILHFAWCCHCCWQIRYHTASMPPEAYWHAGAAQRFSNRLELFQFCRWQIWTDMLPPVFPGCNNNERLIYKTCSTINSWIDFLLGITGAALFWKSCGVSSLEPILFSNKSNRKDMKVRECSTQPKWLKSRVDWIDLEGRWVQEV